MTPSTMITAVFTVAYLAVTAWLCGVLLAILLRFIGQMLSGVVFFSQNAWDGWGAWGYSITYHLSCKIPEGTATTLIMLALPLKTIQNAIGGKQS